MMASATIYNPWDDELPEDNEFLVGGKRARDIQSIKPPSASFYLKQLTSYEVYTLIPIGESEDNVDNEDKRSKVSGVGNKDEDISIGRVYWSGLKRKRWTKVQIKRERCPQEEIIKTIRKLDAGQRSIIEKKAKLFPHQSMQITNILNDKIRNEKDGQFFEWIVAQLHQEESENPKTKRKETTSMTIYLKRCPKPVVDVVRLYHERQRDYAYEEKQAVSGQRVEQGKQVDNVDRPTMPITSENDMALHNYVNQENTGSVPLSSAYDSNQEDQLNIARTTYWSVSDQNNFLLLVETYGTDWHGIAKSMGTKTHIMVKDYYQRLIDSNRPDIEEVARIADETRMLEESVFGIRYSQIISRSQLHPQMPMQAQQIQRLHYAQQAQQQQPSIKNRALDSLSQFTPEELATLMLSEVGGRAWDFLVFKVAQRCMDTASEEEKNNIRTYMLETIPPNSLKYYQSVGQDLCYSYYYGMAEYHLRQERQRQLANQQVGQRMKTSIPESTVPMGQLPWNPNSGQSPEPQQSMLGTADSGFAGSEFAFQEPQQFMLSTADFGFAGSEFASQEPQQFILSTADSGFAGSEFTFQEPLSTADSGFVGSEFASQEPQQLMLSTADSGFAGSEFAFQEQQQSMLSTADSGFAGSEFAFQEQQQSMPGTADSGFVSSEFDSQEPQLGIADFGFVGSRIDSEVSQQQTLNFGDFGFISSRINSQHKNTDLTRGTGQIMFGIPKLNTQEIRAWDFLGWTNARKQNLKETGLADHRPTWVPCATHDQNGNERMHETRPEARKNIFQDVYLADETRPERAKASNATLRTAKSSGNETPEESAQNLEEAELEDYVLDCDPWKTGLEEHFMGSRFPKEQKLEHSLQEAKLEKHATETEDEAAEGSFTDSAYVSMHRTDIRTNDSSLPFEPRRPVNDNSHATMGDSGAEDKCETIYSAATTIDLPNSQQYIAELCTDIFTKLENYFDSTNWNTLEVALPSLIKAFAVKIGHGSSAQVHQDIMYFIHRQHKDIISHLKVMFCRNDDAQPIGRRSGSKVMSLHDKMTMWDNKSGENGKVTESDEFFKGVMDDDDEVINDVDLSKYHGIVLKSPSYEWLLSSLRKERVLQWGSRQPRIMVESIRQKILDRLPTGTISKRRPLSACELTFNLQWGDSDKENGLFARLITSEVLLSELITVTGCREESQALSVEQYLCQTWPVYGLQLLNVLKKAIAYRRRHHSVTLPDNTQLSAAIRGSSFTITAIGPAHFLAECAEQLAWIQTALLSNSRNRAGYYAPSIKNYVVKTVLLRSRSKQSKYKSGHCDIVVKFSPVANPTDDIQQKQSWWQNLAGKNTVIRGYPISRRPEGYSGLELSFELLLSSVQTDKPIIADGLVLLEGPVSTLQLAKNTNGVFLWLPVHPRQGLCSRGNNVQTGTNLAYSSFDLRRLKFGRHILGVCTDLPTAMEEYSEGTCEKSGASETRYFQHGASRDTAGPSDNVRTTAASQSLFVHPDCQEDEKDSNLSISSQVDYSDVKNSLPDYTENTKGNFLLNEEAPDVEDSPSDSIMSSRTESLDSDLLSISDSSEQFEVFEGNATVNTFIDNVVNKLLSGFRRTTQCQFSPATNGNSGQCTTQAAATGSSPSSNNSGRPQKRRRTAEEEEDDDVNQDDFPKPPRKKGDHGSDKTIPRLFACPYLKMDPVKHSNCCTKKLRRIRDVKQHLTRRHTPDRYCQRCLSTNFCDEQALQGHVDLNTCLRNDPTALEGISNEQHKRLTRKSDSKISEEDQWFVVWEILFLRLRRPSSAYLETGLSMELGLFREYCLRHVPSTIDEQLVSDPIWAGSESTREERQVYDQMVLARGLNRLFEEYSRSTSSSGSQRSRNASYREHRGDRLQHVQYAAPLSSIADSAIAIGSQFSPREMNSQRQIPNQPVFTPDNGGQHAQYEASASFVTDSEVGVHSQFSPPEMNFRRHIPNQPAFTSENGPQNTQHEAPVSLVADSGMGVGSQFSPSEMSSGQNIPSQFSPLEMSSQLHIPTQLPAAFDNGVPSAWMTHDASMQKPPGLGDDMLEFSNELFDMDSFDSAKLDLNFFDQP